MILQILGKICMKSINPSFTDKYVLGPIFYLNESPPANSKYVQFFRREIVSRIIGLSTVIFASLDAGFHAIYGLSQGISLCLRKICALKSGSFSEPKKHFERAVQFTFLSLIGPFIGSFFPFAGLDTPPENQDIQCPLSLDVIPNRWKIDLNNTSYDVRYLVLTLLEKPNPLNPITQQPIDGQEMGHIADLLGVSVGKLWNLWRDPEPGLIGKYTTILEKERQDHLLRTDREFRNLQKDHLDTEEFNALQAILQRNDITTEMAQQKIRKDRFIDLLHSEIYKGNLKALKLKYTCLKLKLLDF